MKVKRLLSKSLLVTFWVCTVSASASALNLQLTNNSNTPVGTLVTAEHLVRTSDSVRITVIGENTPYDNNNWLGWTPVNVRAMNSIIRPTVGAGSTRAAVPPNPFGLSLLNDVNLGTGVFDSLYTTPDDAQLFSEDTLSRPSPNNTYNWFYIYDVSSLGFQNYRWHDGDDQVNSFSGDYDLLIFVDDDHTAPNFDYDDFMAGIVDARPAVACDYVTAPTLTFPADFAVNQCTPASICATYSTTGSGTESIISAPPGATINTGTNQICFTPGASGSYTIIARIQDACGNQDRDTIVVTVTLNSPPVLSFGADVNTTQCTPTSICATYSVSDPDGLAGHVETLVSGPPGATINTGTNQVCFTPGASGTYTIIARVVDPCGAEDRDTIVYNVTLNSPPVLTFGPDTNVSQCVAAPICMTYSVSDPDGLTGHVESIVSAPPGASINTSTNEVCFTPGASGSYTVIVKVVDPCTAEDRDTININVTINSAPVLTFGPDTSVSQCAAAPICVTYAVSDPNGLAGHVESIVSAPPGASINTSTNEVCFTPGASGSYTVIVKVVDPCTAEDRDTININVTINSAPTIAFGADMNVFQCTAAQICAPYVVSDPNGMAGLVETLVSGPAGATIDTAGNQVCFTPAASGTYTIITKVTDACGALDKDTIVLNITINSAPTIAFGVDMNVGQCTPAQICATYAVSDPNGMGGLVETLVTGPAGATLDTAGNQVCFTPAGPGSYTIIAKVTDSCGAFDKDTIVVNVTVNNPPTIAFGADLNVFQCAVAQICAPYTVGDPDGMSGLVETLVSGPAGATIDTASNQVCFTPAGPGTYTIIAKVTDACGAFDKDTIVVNVTINSAPTIAFGADLNLFQCTAAQICAPYVVSDPNGMAGLLETLVSGPAGATIDTAGNQVCFTPAASGSYTIIAKATDSCGVLDKDTIVINVTINSAPTIAFGADMNVGQCTPAQICASYSVSDANGMAGLVETLVSGPAGATIDTAGNQVCFTPAGPGMYTIIAKVTDSCGAIDKDTIFVNVTLNNPPSIAFGADFNADQCVPSQICAPYVASDPDGPAGLIEALVSGPPGAVIDTAGNQVCFTPAGPGSYTIIAKVTDACGAEDRDTIVVTINNSNQPPVVNFPTSPLNVDQCVPAQICMPYTVTDAGPPPILEALVSGPAGTTLDTVGNQVCFTPAGPGNYQVIVEATDACGAKGRDTAFVTVTNSNQPPSIAFGADMNVSQCAPAQICAGYSVSDPNGPAGLVEALVSGPVGATIDTAANTVCFTPAGPGNYTIIAKVTDACGVEDRDTIVVTVTNNNQPPSIAFGADMNLDQCTPAQICAGYTVSDPNGPAGLVEALVSGPAGATIDTATNNVCFTPAGPGTYTIIAKVTDGCGVEDRDTIVVNVTNNNQAPVIALEADFTEEQCSPAQICASYTVSDPNGGSPVESLVSGPPGAAINTALNQVCFTPAGIGNYTIIVQATDGCNASDRDTIHITVETCPPVPCPILPDTIFERICDLVPVCVQLNTQADCQVISGPGQVVNGVYCYTPGSLFDTVDVTLQCDNGSGNPCQKDFTLAVYTDQLCGDCPAVCIDTTTAAPGSPVSLCVTATAGGVPWGGFDFLFHYDVSMLTFMGVDPGQFLVDCDWEYFTYRLVNGQSGLVRVVAIADMNNSNDHPLCLTPGPGDVILCLNFKVTNDWSLSCRDALVQWYWNDCGDNSISNPSGDTLYIAGAGSGSVVNYDGVDLTGSGAFGGPPFPCPSDKGEPQECMHFCGGKIKIICPGDIDARGDLNLNAVSYEIADAVLYSRYFISGPSVFVVNALGQIAASDVNADGVTLTVADLVYLIRVITGDELPISDDLLGGGPKAAILGDVSVSAETHGGQTIVSTRSDFDLGAALFVFNAEGTNVTHVEPTARAQGMDVTYQVVGGQLRVLLCNVEERARIDAGSGELLIIRHEGKAGLELVEAEAATFSGGLLNTDLSAEKVLPTQFALHENHPNPFNPSTSFRVDLPAATNYTLVIYNIAGQAVRTFTGNAAAGSTLLHWDGKSQAGQPVASGVYFYQISAGPWHDVRKMVLMK